jgi:N-methylhydantoinase B
MKAGERFMLQSAGGGGYGDPGQRDPKALAQDVAEGYVSHQAQLSDYRKN